MSRWFVVLVAAWLPLVSFAQVNAIPSEPHLLVKGHAEGSYVPDRFSIHLQVEVTDMRPEVQGKKSSRTCSSCSRR